MRPRSTARGAEGHQDRACEGSPEEAPARRALSPGSGCHATPPFTIKTVDGLWRVDPRDQLENARKSDR